MIKSNIIFLVTSLFLITVSANGTEKEATGYTGSSSCQECHEEAYNTWKSSKHAGEFKTDQENSQTCNLCHSTGSSATNRVPLEMNVGCEACHGPGKEHVSSEGDPEKTVKTVSADICGRCHNGNRSDDMTCILEYKTGMTLSDIKG